MKLQKITNQSDAARRKYDDACGTAHALELIGERWALLVVRELMLGPKRFTDLRGDLPGISANVLTQRLESLETAGIVVKRKLAPPASVQVYELTPWGYESEPIFQTLGRWAARSPGHDPSLPLSAVSLMLSFRTMFDAGRAGDLKARIGFRMGAESYLVRIGDGELIAARDPLDDTDLTFTGPPTMIAAAVYGGVPLEALDALTVEGDQALARRFTTFFPLPPKVGAE
jgi:DNA-binding HxlR family transcriptional regulator